MKMRIIWLLMMGLVSLAHAGNILLLDQLDGASKNLVNGQVGKVSEKTEYVPTSFGKGFYSGPGTGNRCVTYPAMGNFNPLQGTLEMWVQTGPEFGKGKNHEHLASLTIDGNNSIGLYYNGIEKKIIFWIRDTDTPGKNIANQEYNTFIPGPVLGWGAGEKHHIAVTWEKNHEMMFIDGKASRWQEYRGQVYADFNEKSKIEIARDSNFLIDAVRIWDYARAPRKIDREPILDDAVEHFSHLTHPSAIDIAEIKLSMKNAHLYVEATSGLPAAMIDTQKRISLIYGKTSLLFDGKKQLPNGSMTDKNDIAEGTYSSYSEPGIAMKSRFSVKHNAFLWELELQNNTGNVWRKDVAVVFPALASDAMAFMPAEGNPFSVRQGNIAYCSSKLGSQLAQPAIYLPLATVYQPVSDYGFTICQPMDVPEYLTVDFGHELVADELGMINRNVTIEPGASRILKYYLVVHPGDWRAGLGWLAREFSAKFHSFYEKNERIDGSMIIGGASDLPFLKNMSELGVVYREISSCDNKQILFGQFIPENPNETTLKFYQDHVKGINNLHQANILGLYYIEANSCQDIEYAKKNFPDSIQYDTNGKIIEFYSFGALMLCRPGSNWFRHLCRQAELELKHISDADGIFFDNCWDKEYAPVINAIADIAHKRGLFIATNGASSNCIAASDSIMAEGTRRALEGQAFMGLSKPVTYVPINTIGGFGIVKEREHAAPALPENLQLDLKSCLLNGAFYSFNYRGAKYFDEESMKMYQHFLPLQNELKGKSWYLEPHAIKTPDGIRSNIFINPKGELIAFITSDGLPFKGEPLKNFQIRIRLQAEVAFASVSMRHLEDFGETGISGTLEDRTLVLPVKGHRSITMLRVKFK